MERTPAALVGAAALMLAAFTASAAPLRVALTFDDSLKDHLLVAAPMLEERGWRGTFCIVTDWVGKNDMHLVWDDVRELVRRGHKIATHTKSHQNLVALLEKGQEETVRREIRDSADKIAFETGVAPRFMVAPFGKQNETTARICRELGLRQAEVPRYNFGSNNCERAAAVVKELRQKGVERADLLHHGVSQADHGGWCSFSDRESFRRHLDALAELERRGEIVVTDYSCIADAGFYRVENGADGAWRLIDPSGKPTIWLGVDHVKFNGFRCEAENNRMHYREANIKKFVTRAAWASNTVERLRGWGFNALGAGCDNADLKGFGLGRTVFFALGDSATSDDEKDHEHYLVRNFHTPGTAFPNVFNPDFAERCERAAAKACAANRDDPEVLGYFIDNELAWEGRNRGATRPWGLFDAACAKPQGDTARMAVERLLARRGLKIGDDIPVSVKEEFVGIVAERYFSVTAAAIRKHDPNHLVLGCRFAGAIVPDVVWRMAGRHCDVVTLNAYSRTDLEKGEVWFWYRDRFLPIGEAMAKVSALAGRPVMLTEWSFPAFDSGLQCRNGAGQRFDTQIERAWASRLYAETVLSIPCVIGYDYFMWVDMPEKGISRRFPEDTNYGLVREDGTEYRELTAALAKVQKAALRGGAVPGGTHLIASAQSALAAVYDPATNAFARPPAFTFSNGAYCVKNAAGLELRGRIGGRFPIEKIAFADKDYGRFSAMIQTQGALNPKSRSGYEISSHGVKNVSGVDWRVVDGRGILSLKCDAGVAMLDLEIGVAPKSRNFIAEVKRVANAGKSPLAVNAVLLLPYAPFTNVVESAKRPGPSLMALTHCAAAWLERDRGRHLGVLTDSPFIETIDFWKDKSGGAHPDVLFTPVRPAHGGRLVIAPGESWTPEAPLHALIRAGEGGAEEWGRFSRRVPRVAVSADFSRTVREIKPVHGVGQPPFFGRNYKLFQCLKDAHVPYSRLHDVGGAVSGQDIYVDIPNLFKDFDANPENPASYSFAFTDDLLHALVTNGIAPYFRLGVSIENYVVALGPRKIFPPKDNLKWAKICEGVVRHYTEGWANGFKWKIDYWEIWNEPDGEEPPESNAMWRGTFKQYLDLYGTAQKYLKAKFPHLQFGAYGSCGFSALCSNWKPERAAHHMRCFNEFMAYIKEHNCPPDFFSFHCYGPWRHIEKQANHARRELDKAGLKNVPIHLTEWLSAHGVGTAQQAALLADTIVRLQGFPIDLAAVYDARCAPGIYSPLFDPAKWAPRKAYYGFRAFGDLYALGTEASVSCSNREIAALAAVGSDGAAAMMVVNPTGKALPFISDFGGRKVKSVRVTDESRDWDEVNAPSVLTPYSIWLFQLSRQ